MTPVIRAYEATVDDVKPGERSVVAKINSRNVDRHRTVISPDGIDLVNYRKNPIVLWEHGRDPARGTMPVGKNAWIKQTSDGLVAKTIFRDDAYSQELFRAYQEGDLRGWSVNVLADEASPPTKDELRAMPDMARCDLVYRKTELAEYSGVAIPSNRDSLTVLASRGIWIPDEALGSADAGAIVSEEVSSELTELELALEQLKSSRGRTFAATQFELVSMIRAVGQGMKADAEAYRDLYLHGRV